MIISNIVLSYLKSRFYNHKYLALLYIYFNCYYQMSKQNIQVQNSLLSSIPKNVNEDNSQQITQEINNLKNIVLQLEKRHLAIATKRSDLSPLKSSKQSQEEQLHSKIAKRQEQSRIRFGADFYSDINQRFKARIHHKKISVINETHQTTLNKKEEKNGEDEKSIIYLCQDQKKGENFILSANNLDPEEDQPAKTQFFQPAPRSQPTPIEFHFKKLDLLPVIEQDHKRFTSYLKTQRQKQHNNRYRINSHSTSKSGSFSSASQPQLESKKDVTANYITGRFPQPSINKDSSKQQLIAFGKIVFKHFLPFFDPQAKFTIKKYKNCIIFSLMPEITKGIILYYSEEVYFGNISVNQKGKIEKNGPGYEYLPDKHFYEGHFVNGKKNGKGKITHKNGDQYEGQWSDGEINGFGTFIERKSNKKHQGFWKSGEYCGNLVNAKFLTAKIA